jgi:very-short-patch-repair endonuclease
MKDRLLQENGYLVLRFLATDVGKDLESVLDAILHAVMRSSLASGNLIQISGRARQ